MEFQAATKGSGLEEKLNPPQMTASAKTTLLPARAWGLLLFASLPIFAFWNTLVAIAQLALHDDRYTYLAAIPLITGYLLHAARMRIHEESRLCPWPAAPLALLGMVLAWMLNQPPSVPATWRLSLAAGGILLIWISAFLGFFGPQSVKRAVFPLCFLFLAVPIPSAMLDKVVVALQHASADASFQLFHLLGVPVLRDGLTFSLPGVDIQIAEECSGIRSSISLFVASIVVGHLFLRSASRRTCLSLLTIPVVIFKNAVRIVTIAWLGVYANRDFFYGALHHSGGLVFSALSLAILTSVLFLLQRSELRRRQPLNDGA